MRDQDPSIEPTNFEPTSVTVRIQFSVDLQPEAREDFRNRVREGFKRNLSVRQLLEDPNVRALLNVEVLLDDEEVEVE